MIEILILIAVACLLFASWFKVEEPEERKKARKLRRLHKQFLKRESGKDKVK